jgi:hypothetical protein
MEVQMRPKLSYANVMVTILAFVVLGGGAAYAAFKLPKNSVGTKQIKPNAVTGSKVAPGSLTGTDVAAGSLTGADVNPASLGTVPSAANANFATKSGLADYASRTTKADTAAAAENGGHAIIYDEEAQTVNPEFIFTNPFFTIDELTLKSACVEFFPITELWLEVSSTVPSDVNYEFVTRASNSGASALSEGMAIGPPNEEQLVLQLKAPEDGFARGEGQIIYHHGNQLIAIALHAITNSHTLRCQVTGVAVPASG